MLKNKKLLLVPLVLSSEAVYAGSTSGVKSALSNYCVPYSDTYKETNGKYYGQVYNAPVCSSVFESIYKLNGNTPKCNCYENAYPNHSDAYPEAGKFLNYDTTSRRCEPKCETGLVLHERKNEDGCPAGTYQDRITRPQVNTGKTKILYCGPCLAGQWTDGKECYDCSIGNYCPERSVKETGCHATEIVNVEVTEVCKTKKVTRRNYCSKKNSVSEKDNPKDVVSTEPMTCNWKLVKKAKKSELKTNFGIFNLGIIFTFENGKTYKVVIQETNPCGDVYNNSQKKKAIEKIFVASNDNIYNNYLRARRDGNLFYYSCGYFGSNNELTWNLNLRSYDYLIPKDLECNNYYKYGSYVNLARGSKDKRNSSEIRCSKICADWPACSTFNYYNQSITWNDFQDCQNYVYTGRNTDGKYYYICCHNGSGKTINGNNFQPPRFELDPDFVVPEGFTLGTVTSDAEDYIAVYENID